MAASSQPNLPPVSASTGFSACLDLGCDLARLAIDTAAAQAELATKIWGASLTGAGLWPSREDWLLLLEQQSEQFADGLRHTLQDFGSERAGPAHPSLPD